MLEAPGISKHTRNWKTSIKDIRTHTKLERKSHIKDMTKYWKTALTFRNGQLRTQKLKSHLMRTQSVKVFPLKIGSRSVYCHACYANCRESFLANFYPSGPFTRIFPKNLSQVFPVLAVAHTGSCVGPQNKIGYSAGCRFPR